MRSIAIIIWFLFSAQAVSAQYFEFGLYGGVSNYQGDLAPVAFVPKETHFAYGVFSKYNFNKYLSVKASFYTGEVSGSDANSNDSWNQNRNLSFKSKINEFSVFGEINIAGFNPHFRDHLFTPYAFIGVGVFHFNPMANYMGQWYDLQPLGTEGQGTSYYPDRHPYKLTQFSIPIGAGFKASLSRHFNVGIELGWRKTFTDYIDDVSTTYVAKEILEAEKGEMSWELSNRSDEVNGGVEVYKDDRKLRGDAGDLDWYIFSGIIMSYNFDLTGWDQKKFKYKEGSRLKGNKNSKKEAGCPTLSKQKK